MSYGEEGRVRFPARSLGWNSSQGRSDVHRARRWRSNTEIQSSLRDTYRTMSEGFTTPDLVGLYGRPLRDEPPQLDTMISFYTRVRVRRELRDDRLDMAIH